MHTLILGLDAFDPTVFERLSESGQLPNLTQYVKSGGYSRFTVTNPPQSEVSWTSIATGLDPGGHGVFDFVHRDPKTYGLNVSLLPTQKSFGGTQFVRPFSVRTIFDHAVAEGYPATALWWPAMFPAQRGSPVRTIPGLGTPDLLGRWGVGTLFSPNPELADTVRKTAFSPLKQASKGQYVGHLSGPIRKKWKGTQKSTIDIKLTLTGDDTATLNIGGQSIELREGVWSPIIEVSFKLGFFVSVKAITRVIVSQMEPDIKLYALPLQLHPLRSPWPYGTPGGFVKQTWKQCGPFLTVGWPQDTTGLEEGCITDQQFLDLCRTIFSTREHILMHHLGQFDEGILASVFDSLDRIQHMFWRDRPDVVEEWYVKFDGLVGRVKERLVSANGKYTRLVIVSDHGFSEFEHKVHLNQWLVKQEFLVTKDKNGQSNLRNADWTKTKAYAVGLNSIYLNLVGREGQGSVSGKEEEAVMADLRSKLMAWKGPGDTPVVKQTWSQNEAFSGPFASYGPDLVVGFSAGYRASAQTGLGEWEQSDLEQNQDHWGADHCIDPQLVPGVLFSNQQLHSIANPSFRDIPSLTIGTELDPGNASPPPSVFSEEDQEVVEERLRSLGYL